MTAGLRIDVDRRAVTFTCGRCPASVELPLPSGVAPPGWGRREPGGRYGTAGSPLYLCPRCLERERRP